MKNFEFKSFGECYCPLPIIRQNQNPSSALDAGTQEIDTKYIRVKWRIYF